MRETQAILCELLYQAKDSKDIDDVIFAIEVMCTKKEIAMVNDALAKKNAKKNEKKNEN